MASAVPGAERLHRVPEGGVDQGSQSGRFPGPQDAPIEEVGQDLAHMREQKAHPGGHLPVGQARCRQVVCTAYERQVLLIEREQARATLAARSERRLVAAGYPQTPPLCRITLGDPLAKCSSTHIR